MDGSWGERGRNRANLVKAVKNLKTFLQRSECTLKVMGGHCRFLSREHYEITGEQPDINGLPEARARARRSIRNLKANEAVVASVRVTWHKGSTETTELQQK